jgi:hypothetical protein
MSMLTQFINEGIAMINSELTKYEQHKTRTRLLTRQIIKMLSTQFINTAIIYYLISTIKGKPLMSSTGLVLQISSLLAVSGIMQIGLNLINIPYLSRKWMLWSDYNYWDYNASKNKNVNTFQVNLNKAY